MRQDAERYYATDRGIATLLLGLLLPPAAWLVHVEATFVLSTRVCASGHEWTLHLTTLLALAVALTGGWLAWRNWRATGSAESPDRAGTLARSNFLAVAGLASAAFFTVAILAAELTTFFISPCW